MKVGDNPGTKQTLGWLNTLPADGRNKEHRDNLARLHNALKEVRAEGEAATALAIANTMLIYGEPEGKITRYTGLTVEEISCRREAR